MHLIGPKLTTALGAGWDNSMNSLKHSGKLKAVTFSYDDGVTQDIRLVELLNQYGLKATFNLNSETLGTRGMLGYQGKRISHYKIHKEDVKDLYAGHEVAVHTLNHPNLTQLSDAEVLRQVVEDQRNLEALVGYPVVGMAYPCGGKNHDERVANLIRENTSIQYCRTILSTDSFDVQQDLYRFVPNVCHVVEFDRLMELGRKFVEMKPTEPQIFYIWGHSYEMDYHPDDWLKLEAFFKFISNREDVFYGTNGEIFL